MSAAGYCYDNAFAESAFATLKAELPGADRPFDSKAQARLAIFDYLETFYNHRRRRAHRMPSLLARARDTISSRSRVMGTWRCRAS